MAERDEQKGFKVTDRRTVSVDGAGEPGDAPVAAVPEREAPRPAQDPADEARSLPQIDFMMFAMSLASSALIHLGELGAPDEEEPQPNLPIAKQTIDIIGMLQEKTRGNLSDEEARVLEHLLYDLRLKYVDARKRS